MQKLDFASAVDLIVKEDPRFDRDAYFFLRDVLEFTASEGKKGREGRSSPHRHITGQQLLEGVRRCALGQFGPMVMTVFGYWGITRCEDFGEMVYSLIAAGFFRKSEQDSPDDFKGGYSFEEAFVLPFKPTAAVPVKATGRVRRREAKAS